METLRNRLKTCSLAASCLLVLLFPLSSQVYALGSQQNPQSGSLGLEATIPSPPPTAAATVALPGSGQSFTSLPITVSGLCQNNLLIKILTNNIFVGSAECASGSYSLKIDLYNGVNDIVAQDYDALGQEGPASSAIEVNFSDAQTIQSGSQVTVTSNYAELGANPGQEIDWPVVISGGTPPYAISTDWGDSQSSTLQTSATGGSVTLKHTYSSAGVYQVTVTVTDSNGETGFLQLVGVANGQVQASSKSTTSSVTNNSNNSTTSLGSSISTAWWLPGAVLITLVPAFWLGSRHRRSVLLKKYK